MFPRRWYCGAIEFLGLVTIDKKKAARFSKRQETTALPLNVTNQKNWFIKKILFCGNIIYVDHLLK